jgi:molecular chaperone GrpE
MVKKKSDNLPEEEKNESIDQETTDTNINNTEEIATEEQPSPEAEEKCSEAETLKNTINELNDKYLRLSAEFDNYRKRTLKEKMELTKTAGESVLVGLLPVVDDFERAIKHIGESDSLDALRQGVDLIYNKFRDFLSQKGVTEIEAINQVFNTDVHEAVTNIPAPAPEMKGKILDCIEKGYMLNDKVIRFSKVVVCE